VVAATEPQMGVGQPVEANFLRCIEHGLVEIGRCPAQRYPRISGNFVRTDCRGLRADAPDFGGVRGALACKHNPANVTSKLAPKLALSRPPHTFNTRTWADIRAGLSGSIQLVQ
jgi:hypothetical protein